METPYDQKLLEDVFWHGEEFAEHGLFVCRFNKDAAWVYVIIDDRIPCRRKGKDKYECLFSHTKDKVQMWVQLIEKAYAKLHHSYQALH